MGYHNNIMKRGNLICSLIVLCGIIVLADFQSPRDLAVHLEEKLASFAGLGMPDTNAPCLFFIGVLPLPDCATTNGTGFLPSFTNGLVSVLEYDIETFPVAICVENDNDGITVFRNSDDIAFHWEFPTLSPYYSDWIVQLFGRDPSTLSTLTLEMLRPSHVRGQAIFVAEENLQAYNEARLAAPPPQSGTPFPR